MGAGRKEENTNHRQKINTHFVALNDLSRQMQPPPETGISGDSVPRNVAENVDGYRNPHSYTKNTLSRAVGENQYALGRILGLEVGHHSFLTWGIASGGQRGHSWPAHARVWGHNVRG